MGLFNRRKKRKSSGAAAASTPTSSSSSSQQPSTPASSSDSSKTPPPPPPPPVLSPDTEKRAARDAEGLAVLVQALRGEVEAEAGRAGAGGLANARKRALYYEAEMLWQRVKDELPAGSSAAAPILDDIDALERALLKLAPQQLATRPIPRLVQRLDRLLRVVTCALYLCLLGVVTFPPMVTVVPLVDAVLRRLGWPKRYLLYEFAKKASARGFLWLAGVFYQEEGRLPEYETPAVLLFQHGSNLDGFLILDSYPQFFKSIGKDDIFLMPFVGWMAYVYGILPIDRAHRHEAIKQLARATNACRSGIAVALSPEGTRSKSGQLMRFKKGPFYVQAEAGGATVTPLVILGNYELWPPTYYFTCPGQVVMRYLPPIDPAALPDSVRGSKEELSRYVRRQMFEAIHDITSQPAKYGTPGGPLSWPLRLLNLASIGCFWMGAAGLWRLVTAVSDAHGFSRAALGGGFLCYSVTVTAALYVGYAKMVR